MRIQEAYPTRFDAGFDLNKGEIIGTFMAGDLVADEQLTIEDLGDGWFKCVIEAEVFSSYFRLVFGPTTVKANGVRIWEAESINKSDRKILIVPSSLVIEELSY